MRFINFLKKEGELKDTLPFEKLRSQKVELEKIVKKIPLNREQGIVILEAKRLLTRVKNILEAL